MPNCNVLTCDSATIYCQGHDKAPTKNVQRIPFGKILKKRGSLHSIPGSLPFGNVVVREVELNLHTAALLLLMLLCHCCCDVVVVGG